MAKKFYLETSIIRSRLFGHPEIKNLLIEKLKNKSLITSQYVKMEFDRGYVCDLIAFYFVLKTQKKISDAFQWWIEDFSGRKLKNVASVFAQTFSGIKNEDVVRARLKLRELIKSVIVTFNALFYMFENNNSDCYLSTGTLDFRNYDSVGKIESAFDKFRREFRGNYVGECKVMDFLKTSRSVLDSMLKETTKNSGFENQKTKLQKILSGKSKISCTSCSGIGDTIIALECPKHAILITQDSAFDELCKIIGLKYEIMPSLRTVLPKEEIMKQALEDRS